MAAVVSKIFAPLFILFGIFETIKGFFEGFANTEGSFMEKLMGGLAGALASVGFYTGVANVSSTWVFHIPVVIDYTVFSQIIGFVLFAALLTTPVGVYRIGRMNLLEVVARHER